ncbi:MAG: hypothetical protein HN995_11650 [Candidatus Marinimicrobia bacterium]|nr:hypothetical protein [Candidatus Neomarinimicrobiota bacterium]MBT3575115.1 hypothetical protein [Candidatus Neomarinimicrobiota bacterium]MBT3678887.1 hypothetical protein [Candidatus Neomarinimicrobiota bacterium]MBT3950001.1 hypothetical protein [Candidatus Neomarinimicrobiota bacterium]MBT4252704.1 hypothetical protein [Candidatus Neomarinimicrobiota bacterium]
MISAAVTGYLLISGILLQFSGRFISAARQHQLAFVSIIVLVAGIFPQLRLPLVAPGIIFHLGMMLFALHLSAYYSGTSKNSAHMYSLILYLAAVVLAPLSHHLFVEWSLSRFLIMGGTWLVLLELERTVSDKSYSLSTAEKNLLWVWFVSAVMGLWERQVQLLPDLFFLVILVVHLEKRWPKLTVPAPLIALYGMLITWYGHYTLSGIPGHVLDISNVYPPATPQLILIGLAMIGLLVFGLRSRSIAKQFLYLFLAQETLLLGTGLENFFQPSQELIGLQRILLFVSLVGLFVMIESKENEGLDKAGLSGLVFERPRFTSSVVLVSMFFAFYPLVYIAGDSLIVTVMLIGIVLMSVGWAANLIRILFTRVDRNYRILRASLSIWSTVVFTILWAAVVLLEIVIRNVFS